MAQIEWPYEDMKVRKNISIDASLFMKAWRLIHEKNQPFSQLVNDLLKEWLERGEEHVVQQRKSA